MSFVITQGEAERLKKLERIVDKGKRTFIEVGNALKELRDGKLYRQTHRTFESYCEERFGFKRQQAYRFIEASEVVENVSHGGQISSERAAREVAKAPPEKQQEVVTKAIETAEKTGKPVTAKLMAAARDAVLSGADDEYEDVEDDDDEPEVVEPAAKKPKHPGDHIKTELFANNKADVSITQLEGIPKRNKHRDAALKRVADWIDSNKSKERDEPEIDPGDYLADVLAKLEDWNNRIEDFPCKGFDPFNAKHSLLSDQIAVAAIQFSNKILNRAHTQGDEQPSR
tara:strand:+ start:4058 stop:4912 length:855 start_codon:yes stop_codon:yes gene_type:complete